MRLLLARLPALLASVSLVVGCGGSARSTSAGAPDASDDGTLPDGAPATDAGSEPAVPAPGPGERCNGLALDDIPSGHYDCPGECSVCVGPTSGGGAIADGVYALVGGEADDSACGILMGEDTFGKVVIHGSLLDFAYDGPVNFDQGDAGRETIRETYRFQVSGSQILLTPICATDFDVPSAPARSPADYFAEGASLALPLGVWAQSTYYARQ